MPEYSVLYPQINSLSASGKSNGQRLSSAKILMNKIQNPKIHGIMNHENIPDFEYCAKVIPVMFIDEANTTTDRITKVIGNS